MHNLHLARQQTIILQSIMYVMCLLHTRDFGSLKSGTKHEEKCGLKDKPGEGDGKEGVDERN